MECLIIPGILLGLFFLCLLIAFFTEQGWVCFFGFGIFILWVLSIFACPVNYIKTRNIAWRAEQYYEQIILPNVTEEGFDFVIVSNLEAGIWQAGDSNVFDYNSYVVTTRYWQSIPLIGTAIYDVPQHLKYVRISSENETTTK